MLKDVSILDRNDALHDALVCLKLLECQTSCFPLPHVTQQQNIPTCLSIHQNINPDKLTNSLHGAETLLISRFLKNLI
jgi:hypothetical protein